MPKRPRDGLARVPLPNCIVEDLPELWRNLKTRRKLGFNKLEAQELFYLDVLALRELYICEELLMCRGHDARQARRRLVEPNAPCCGFG